MRIQWIEEEDDVVSTLDTKPVELSQLKLTNGYGFIEEESSDEEDIFYDAPLFEPNQEANVFHSGFQNRSHRMMEYRMAMTRDHTLKHPTDPERLIMSYIQLVGENNEMRQRIKIAESISTMEKSREIDQVFQRIHEQVLQQDMSKAYQEEGVMNVLTSLTNESENTLNAAQDAFTSRHQAMLMRANRTIEKLRALERKQREEEERIRREQEEEARRRREEEERREQEAKERAKQEAARLAEEERQVSDASM
jgi:hypothetical protein